MKPTRIIIAGAMGRMGQTILGLAARDRNFFIEGVVEADTHHRLGEDVGEALNLPLGRLRLAGSPTAALKSSDVLITFTSPKATVEHLSACVRARKNLVIGTTGLSPKQFRSIRAASRKIAIVQAPNMSVGVNLLLTLTELVSGKLGADYDIEITETHHRMKKDAPSGTALKIAEVAARARKTDLAKRAVYGRRGITGERSKGAIGIHAIRGGDVVGKHTIAFMGAGENIVLSHEALSREAFGRGALLAARFIARKKRGLWSMRDVLGL